jgi:hypothetical protein
MDPLNYFIWLVTFGTLTVLQAWLINGVSQAAAGDTEILPDGTEKDSEMIFYPLKKELTKTRKVRYQYFDEQLTKLIDEMKSRYQYAFPEGVIVARPSNVMIAAKDVENFKIFISKYHDKDLIATQMNEAGTQWQFTKEYDVKVYSKWIRKPIIECVKCMASFWSLVTYWPLVLLVFGFHWWQIPVFIADMLVVSFLSWFFNKTVS